MAPMHKPMGNGRKQLRIMGSERVHFVAIMWREIKGGLTSVASIVMEQGAVAWIIWELNSRWAMAP